MLGLVITSYERYEYLQQCLQSVAKSDFPADMTAIIVDDCSKDKRVRELLNGFSFSIPTEIIFNKRRKGNQKNIINAFDRFVFRRYELLMNLDNDAIVKPDWIKVLLRLHEKYPERIVSGFDTQRHKAKKYFSNHVFKESIGGINMLLTAELYQNFLRRTLMNYHYWDWRMSRLRKSDFVVARPSMVQHIGSISTLGHRGADYSTTF